MLENELKKFLDEATELRKNQQNVYLRDKSIAKIMTNMERKYNIPMLSDPDWEAKNKEIITVYRKISNMREF